MQARNTGNPSKTNQALDELFKLKIGSIFFGDGIRGHLSQLLTSVVEDSLNTFVKLAMDAITTKLEQVRVTLVTQITQSILEGFGLANNSANPQSSAAQSNQTPNSAAPSNLQSSTAPANSTIFTGVATWWNNLRGQFSELTNRYQQTAIGEQMETATVFIPAKTVVAKAPANNANAANAAIASAPPAELVMQNGEPGEREGYQATNN